MSNGIVLIFVVITIILVVCILVMSINQHDKNTTFITTKSIFKDNIVIDELPQHHIDDQPYGEVPEDQFRAFNPSVSLIGDDMVYSFRISNYIGCTINSGKATRDPIKIIGDNIKSLTMLSNGDNEAIYLNIPDRAHSKCVKGFEDARMITSPDNKNIILVANSHSNRSCYTEMHIIVIPYKDVVKTFKSKSTPKILDIKDDQIVRLYIVDSADGDIKPPTNNEKNWMPFFDGDDLMFVYSVNPHIILKCDIKTGACTKVAETSNQKINSSLRGSSQARLYNGQYIAIAHWRTSCMTYLTQIYAFEATAPYRITSISPPFVIDEKELEAKSFIQFVSGFEIYNDIAYITYGEKDCDAKLFKVKMTTLLDSMKHV